MRDEENLVPLFHVLASAMDATVKDDAGHVTKKSLIDAQMALLARVSGRYFDKDGKEICRREIDPNQVLAVALGNLVTPINDAGFQGPDAPRGHHRRHRRREPRRPDRRPTRARSKRTDYATVSENVVDFLTNQERGLEQFYEVIRQGTKF